MIDVIIDKIKSLFSSRLIPLMMIFLMLFGILIHRLFQLQIVEGTSDAQKEEYYNTGIREIKSTRGKIYDRNGKLLAYNELKYAVALSDSALLTTNKDKNAMIYRLIKILEDRGYDVELDFAIELNKQGELEFNIEGNALLRFKKEAYYLKSVNELTEEQRNASAQEVFDFLNTGENYSKFQISDEYSLEDQLKIMKIRFTMATTPKQDNQITQITIATDIDDTTRAAIKENLADLPGVEIKQETIRVYNDSKYFAHMLGYTGLINANELETYNEGKSKDEEEYSSTDYVGKIGLEKEYDSYLKGIKGTEKVTITDKGKVVDVSVEKEPTVGNDLYLTIDRDLQVSLYNLLERNIAEILLSKIVNSMDYGGKGKSAAKITIPIYEVYNALLANNVIDITHFRSEDATDLEKRTYQYFLDKRVTIFSKLNDLLDKDSKVTNEQAGEEMQEYLQYVYSKMISSDVKLLISSNIDRTDSVYLNYQDDKISLSEFLQYAITKNWVDLSQLGIGNEYYSTEELYEKLIAYTMDLLVDDAEFEKKIYRTLIFTKKLSGKEICLLLFDQGVLEWNESDYSNLESGRISAYTFITQKIQKLEITPGELALEPCSGSIVVTNPKTGDVLALVSYPSYDNNKLANKIDWTYYSKLLNDKATPLINRPTMQKTTTGSTFKPLMTLAGLAEGVIDVNTKITDRGVFDKVVPSPSCWKYTSNHSTHGTIDASHALMHSCNYFFYEVGYRLATDQSGLYSDALGISKIQKYADMFGLGSKSGVEIDEATPVISSKDSVRTAIGYGHEFAPIHIARYLTTVANSGTNYDLTLVDKIKDKDNNVILDNSATVVNKIDMFNASEWNLVHEGMYLVVNTPTNSLDRLFGDLGVKVAGKTGTAQVGTNHPHHALFVSYAPYDDPEIAVAVVIPNGYASANAAKVAREVYGVYFNGENEEELLSGDIEAGSATNININD